MFKVFTGFSLVVSFFIFPLWALAGTTLKRPPDQVDSGFTINDPVPSTYLGPRFEPRYDFQNAFQGSLEEPWIVNGQGPDVRDPQQALKFALTLQQYIYEGMFPHQEDPSTFFNPWTNETRYWCHMPWLNAGENGREFLHGLTKEVPANHNPFYPEDKFSREQGKRHNAWGVAFFNAPGCKVIGDIFGTAEQPHTPPRWDLSQFPDGTLSFKLLFTTAPQIPSLEGALEWLANVSLAFRSSRQIQTVRHIQMDISLKDSRLQGLNNDKGEALADQWIMLAYYFDKDYKAPNQFSHWPQALQKMRPMGVQYGFDLGETTLFEGAQSHHITDHSINCQEPLPNNLKDELREEVQNKCQDNREENQTVTVRETHYQGLTRLNGPADNPRSSCLSCHGAAGMSNDVVPGVLSLEAYNQLKTNPELDPHMDFNMQVDLARKLYLEAQGEE